MNNREYIVAKTEFTLMRFFVTMRITLIPIFIANLYARYL